MDISRSFTLEGKVAVVTGGSLGIGAMIAEGLVRAGAKVYIVGRKARELSAAVERLSAWGEIISVQANAAVRADPQAQAAALRDIPMGREGLPEEIAAPVIFLCSRAANYITGAILPVSGGMATLD